MPALCRFAEVRPRPGASPTPGRIWSVGGLHDEDVEGPAGRKCGSASGARITDPDSVRGGRPEKAACDGVARFPATATVGNSPHERAVISKGVPGRARDAGGGARPACLLGF